MSKQDKALCFFGKRMRKAAFIGDYECRSASVARYGDVWDAATNENVFPYLTATADTPEAALRKLERKVLAVFKRQAKALGYEVEG